MNLRVREKEDVAIIQVENYESLFKNSKLQLIDNELKSLGYKQVTLDLASLKKPVKPLLVFKPCKSTKGTFSAEKQLPYEVDIDRTTKELRKLDSKTKFDKKLDKIVYNYENMPITIFKNGKIIIFKIFNKRKANEALINVLSCIRRS